MSENNRPIARLYTQDSEGNFDFKRKSERASFWLRFTRTGKPYLAGKLDGTKAQVWIDTDRFRHAIENGPEVEEEPEW